ncbi:hypothetical protein ASD06_16615 [Angustibacter sp. Root456]|nr:hypothetical protein ASD06_16615 [Angustibacter sp. Root456]
MRPAPHSEGAAQGDEDVESLTPARLVSLGEDVGGRNGQLIGDAVRREHRQRTALAPCCVGGEVGEGLGRGVNALFQSLPLAVRALEAVEGHGAQAVGDAGGLPLELLTDVVHARTLP